MKTSKIDLGRDPLLKVFLHYAVPSVLGMLAMSTAQVVDGIFIGRFAGPEGLAAINLAWPLVMVYSGLSLMIGTGGTTLANIRMGEGKVKEAGGLYTLTLGFLTLLGIIAVITGLGGLRFIPRILGADKTIELLVVDYLRIIMIFAPFFMITFTQDLFIRGDGSPVFPVAAMLTGSAINIVLDYLFVGRWGWGIEGAALATGFSQVVPFFLMMWYLVFRTKWSFSRPKLQWRLMGRMMYNGLSEFVDEVSIGVSLYIFNRVLMFKIGAMGVAAYSISGYVGEIAGIIFFGVAQAIHPGVSYNKGAGKIDRVRGFRNAAGVTSLAIGIIAFTVLQISRYDIAALFVNDPAVIGLAADITFYFSFALLIMGFNIGGAMYFTALDKPFQSAVIALSRSLVMLLIGLFVLPLIFGNTGIWLSFLFAEGFTFLLVLHFLRITRE